MVFFFAASGVAPVVALVVAPLVAADEIDCAADDSGELDEDCVDAVSVEVSPPPPAAAAPPPTRRRAPSPVSTLWRRNLFFFCGAPTYGGAGGR